MKTTNSSVSNQRKPIATRFSVITLYAAGALFAVAASAAGPGTTGAQAQYQKDRAACMSGKSNQDRATCLQEAGAALAEARRGGLTTTDDSTYLTNNMARCVPLPAADQEDCVRRMNGEGTVKGSVEEGGIYRELRRTVPLSELK